MDSSFDSTMERSPLKAVNNNAKSKKPAIEEIYKKKSQLEHILLRPDTYIGSVEVETKQMWVWDTTDEDNGQMVLREISYVPGLYKIFDEILVNAADNKQRDDKMNVLRIDIDADENKITIYNNGKGIPVTMHKEEKIFVPTMIFGHLLTSSNYDDDEKKVVGGRNGYGAKLCNIFSKQFQVETSCKEYRKAFSQVWTDNMGKASEPEITSSTGEDFTRITFHPDLEKFKMQKLDKDIVALFSRRAFDVAATSKGVKVFLNGVRLPVKGFKDYVKLFIDKESEEGAETKFAHEVVNDRWEVAVAVSEKGFQQISFVNSIATTRGGKHVDHVVDQVVTQMTEMVKKKMKKDSYSVKPFQIKNHLWVFVNCLIENPTFDSQTKETMTLQSKNFGSKCSPTQKFYTLLGKTGAVENVVTWAKFKAETELTKKSGKKSSKVDVPKLEDANDAGTKNSIDCTLILTEGDSAKSLVVAGLGVVGRDKYGVFPLRGKLLNVREASHKQILENVEINHIIKILGLKYKMKYETREDLKTLRYGKVMIMTDQDQDGSHIKGLLINFIHHNWPSLLKLDFLEEFITPIVKATNRQQTETISFYSLPEFEEWKTKTPGWNSFTIKYYKGLGTSTSAEAKEYFSDMARHRIKFIYSGAEDDHYLNLAFSKKMIEQRKDWLTASMDERKRRRQLELPEVYLYEKNTKSVTYKDFVNKELILFSNMDNERSIPSLVDGAKPGQRKVLFTCFKRNDKKEVKVAQLAGSVGERSAYHHGEQSLMSTIINLAQNFVGSNNINLLFPSGMFGTRLRGGKDSASPRYINTMLTPLARKLFPPKDDPLMNYLYDDNLRIEPEYYVPIIPMVLVNGAEGIGTGWSTKIPNYNPREIVENVKRMIRGEEIVTMKPWFKGFRGTIDQVDPQKFVVSGEVAVLSDESFEITELPIQVWTGTYKENVLEPMRNPSGKKAAFITDFKEYHTDDTVRFVVYLSKENLKKSLDEGLHKVFKLQTTISTTSMVLFDGNGCLRRYETPEEILREFYPIRFEFYCKRKRYYEGFLEAEAKLLENQARFIIEKNDTILVMEKIDKSKFTKLLIERNYDSDPLKAWMKKNAPELLKEQKEAKEAAVENEDETTTTATTSTDSKDEDESKAKYDFNYLYDMKMRSMLRENADNLIKKRDAKFAELKELQRSTPEQLWERDLAAFLTALDEEEEKEKQAALQPIKPKTKEKGEKGAKKEKPEKPANPADFKPSVHGDRIKPMIDMEKYQPKVKKERKRKVDSGDKPEKTTKRKKKQEEEEEEDVKQPKISNLFTGAAATAAALDSVTDENKTSDDDEVKLIAKKPAAAKLKLKQTTLNFPKVEQRDVDKALPPPKAKKAPVTKKAKKRISSESEDDDVVPIKSTKKVRKAATGGDESDVEVVPSSSQSSAAASSRRPARERKQVNYKAMAGSDDSESEVSEVSTIEDTESSD